MERLSRTELQARNRAAVMQAAEAEFIERGFRDATIDGIADRAGFTRGAIYSNFPGKRTLYFTVLADLAEREREPSQAEPGSTVGEALAALARAWVSRGLAEVDDQPGLARLRAELVPEICADQRLQQPFAQLMKLDAILLALALERLVTPDEPPRRLVPVAEAALTLLQGATQLAAAAPGFVDPFDVITTSRALADVDLGERWPPPHLDFVAPARVVDEAWAPLAAIEALHRQPVRPVDDGLVAILGMHRLEAVEEALRGLPAGADVTALIVSGEPGELGPLARVALAELRSCLRQAVVPESSSRLQVVWDDSGSLAAAAAISSVDDDTEAALRIVGGRVVARAEGRGACHAAASAG